MSNIWMWILSGHSSATVSTLPSAIKSRSCAPPLADPISVTIEENVNATLERDGLKCNFELSNYRFAFYSSSSMRNHSWCIISLVQMARWARYEGRVTPWRVNTCSILFTLKNQLFVLESWEYGSVCKIYFLKIQLILLLDFWVLFEKYIWNSNILIEMQL